VAGGGDGQQLAGVEVGEDENEDLVGQHLDVVGGPDESPAFEARRIGVVGEVDRVFEHLVAIFFEHGIDDGHGVGAEMAMEGRREGGEAEALELDVLQIDLDLGVDEFIRRAAVVVEVVRVEVRGSKHPVFGVVC